ncbi:hypothetical protein GCM10027442_35710 [Emticicia fontis]
MQRKFNASMDKISKLILSDFVEGDTLKEGIINKNNWSIRRDGAITELGLESNNSLLKLQEFALSYEATLKDKNKTELREAIESKMTELGYGQNKGIKKILDEDFPTNPLGLDDDSLLIIGCIASFLAGVFLTGVYYRQKIKKEYGSREEAPESKNEPKSDATAGKGTEPLKKETTTEVEEEKPQNEEETANDSEENVPTGNLSEEVDSSFVAHTYSHEEADSSVFYFKAPANNENWFNDDFKVYEDEKEDTLYKFILDKPEATKARFLFEVNNKEMMEAAMSRIPQWIEPVCNAEREKSPSAKAIITIEEGKAYLKGNRWEVEPKDKAKIKYV